jgi:hypothetical protein
MRKEVTCLNCINFRLDDENLPYCEFEDKCQIDDYDIPVDSKLRYYYKIGKKVNVNHMLEMRKTIRSFNREDLENMKFYYDYEEIKIPENMIEEWDFSGLTNIDFLESIDWEELKNKSQ